MKRLLSRSFIFISMDLSQTGLLVLLGHFDYNTNYIEGSFPDERPLTQLAAAALLTADSCPRPAE